MEISIQISILTWILCKNLNSLPRSVLKSSIMIYDSEVSDMAGRKTRRAIRTKGIAKCFVFEAKRNGKYDDCIRMVYHDLICTIDLKTRNVQHAIEVVLKDLVGIEVEQLPKATFANDIPLEARMLAQIQVADELTTADFIINEENTLPSDGTSKKGNCRDC